MAWLAIGAAYGAVCGGVLAALDASLAVTLAVAVLPFLPLVAYCRRALRRAPQRASSPPAGGP